VNAQPNTVQGRRLPVVDGKVTWPEEPGDYCGPVRGYTGDKLSIFFLKPNARDEGVIPRARSVQHVACPPHTFEEHDDGTLTISPSIGDTAGASTESDGWHGYLEHGVWRQV
jgi:hypothetical protein